MAGGEVNADNGLPPIIADVIPPVSRIGNQQAVPLRTPRMTEILLGSAYFNSRHQIVQKSLTDRDVLGG